MSEPNQSRRIGAVPPASEPPGAPDDASARAALEERLRRAQRMEVLGDLARVVGHDFNNHLTTICGFTELILKGLPEADPLRGRLQLVRQAAEQAAEMSRQLMVLGTRQPADPVGLNLNAVLAELEGMLQRLCGKRVTLEIRAAGDLRDAVLDRALIEQVLVTLAGRARAVMPQGGRFLIETHNLDRDEDAATEPEVPPGSWVVLSLSDTGPGLTDEARSRLFEPFLATAGRPRGSFKMSVVRGIVGRLNGRFFAHGAGETGLTLRLCFPSDAAVRRAAEPPPSPARAGRGGTETILLVEDEEPLRRLGRDLLQAAGYRIVEARDGGEALLLCERHPGSIHLMLTHYNLPILNGRELYERVRPLRPEMRVLYTSGHTAASVIGQGVAAPGSGFLARPYSAATLLSSVRTVLDRREAA